MTRRLPRPTPALTPLQRALGLFAEALAQAKVDPATFRAFLGIAEARLAAEEAALLDREQRP
jgi:hypothetical protein